MIQLVQEEQHQKVDQHAQVNDEGSPSENIEPLKDEDYNITTRRLDAISARYVIIEPYETIYIRFNFEKIPSYMVLNKHYSIQILNEGVEESLPDYITKIFEYYPEYTNILELKLFNYNNLNKTSNIYLVNTELFNGYRDLFINLAYSF